MREPTRSDFDAVFGECVRDPIDGHGYRCLSHNARMLPDEDRCDDWQDRREDAEAILERLETTEHRLEHSNERLVNVHDTSQCESRPCPIHNMTDHSMRSFPQHFRTDRGIVERICPHGVGHPDPDSHPWTDWTHGCDGCCSREEVVVMD